MRVSVRDATHTLMEERDWWRRVGDETHAVLTDTAHELSDEVARTLQYMALLCGALAHDAGWSDDDVGALIASMDECIGYVPDIILDRVASLLRSSYRGR